MGHFKVSSTDNQSISRINARRSIFYNNDIYKGSILRKNDLIMLRPAIGQNPFDYKKFIGKKLKYKKKKGDLLKPKDFC